MLNNQINISTDELKVMLETGFILRDAGKFDAAEKVFKGCIELMEHSEVPEVGLGTVFLHKKDFDFALKTCKEASDRYPKSDYARLHYAEALLFKNKKDEAFVELKKIIENDPDSNYAKTAENLIESVDLIVN